MIRIIYVSLPSKYSCNKHVLYTCNSSVLNQIGTEPLRNKRIFTYFPHCLFILLEGAIFRNNLCTFWNKPNFSKTRAVTKSKTDNINKVTQHATAKKSVTLKVKFCSVRVPLLPIWWRQLNSIQSVVPLSCVILNRNGTVP